MNERLTNTIIHITKPLQLQMFQISLTRDVDQLDGVDMTLHWPVGVPLLEPHHETFTLPQAPTRGFLVGNLALKSPDRPNLFFSQDLFVNQNPDPGDFAGTNRAGMTNTLNGAFEMQRVVLAGSSTVIFCCYKDFLSGQVPGPYQYKVTITLSV